MSYRLKDDRHGHVPSDKEVEEHFSGSSIMTDIALSWDNLLNCALYLADT